MTTSGFICRPLNELNASPATAKAIILWASDFTYDDLGDRHPSEDTHTPCVKKPLTVKPAMWWKASPKKRIICICAPSRWVMKDVWIGVKKEFYDEDGDLLKMLSVKDYDQIRRYWIILTTEMHNVQKEHRTLMELENVVVDQGLTTTCSQNA